MFVLSLWMAMAIIIFITHGRQEYCLTKHLVIIFNTGFCITLILASVTPCARRPGNGIDRGRYGGRLLQAGCVVVYVTYWTWSAMQSSPERPGIVEMSTFLMDEDDLTCQVHDTSLAEDGLLGAASIMMFITVAYIGCDMTRHNGEKSRGSGAVNGLPVSFPSSESCATNPGVLERHEEPRFCVCLQQMPEPTLSPDWFDMQPTRELNGGQVRALLSPRNFIMHLINFHVIPYICLLFFMEHNSRRLRVLTPFVAQFLIRLLFAQSMLSLCSSYA